jgi:hypothetical protein
MWQDGQPSTLEIDVGGVKSSIQPVVASCISLYKHALLTLTLRFGSFILDQYIDEILVVIFFVLVHDRHVFTSSMYFELGIMFEKTCARCLCSR